VLQLNDLQWRIVGEKVSERDRKILEELEGLLGGRAWFAGHRPLPGLWRPGGGIVRLTKPLYHIGTVCQGLLVSCLDAER
jgi:hypothetical protein